MQLAASHGRPHHRISQFLLNLAHLLDHHVLLIAAASAAAIAKDFGLSSWADVIPYTAGSFLLFGFGSIPAGKLGDEWGRRNMMLVFFFGLGLSTAAVGLSQGPISLAISLTLMGLFSSIYHPVGIPMLLARSTSPGTTIGINGLAGNLGLATAAFITVWITSWISWRYAFFIPGLLCCLCGVAFLIWGEQETTIPANRKLTLQRLPESIVKRGVFIITLTATTGSILFNFTTNANAELLKAKLSQELQNPESLAMLLGMIMVFASLTQLVVGKLIDRYPSRILFRTVIGLQIFSFLLAWISSGWWFAAALLLYMVSVFAAIPFSDSLIVRFVDDSRRSRITGLRIACSFGVGSLVVFLLGPLVKRLGFDPLLLGLACVACLTWIALYWLPEEVETTL